MGAMETVVLPVADLPEGDGWELVDGNNFQNKWERPDRLTRANDLIRYMLEYIDTTWDENDGWPEPECATLARAWLDAAGDAVRVIDEEVV